MKRNTARQFHDEETGESMTHKADFIPPDLAAAVLRLNQARLDFRRAVEQATKIDDLTDALKKFDGQLRALIPSLERLGVHLANQLSRRSGVPRSDRGRS